MDKHGIVCALKDMALELGRTPTRDEFITRASRRSVDMMFGGFAQLVQASGLDAPIRNKVKPTAASLKFKFIKRQVESFNIHEIDIEPLIAELGRPLRVIAMPDTHVKNRDKVAIKVFLQFCEWYDPDVFIIMGDFLDAEGISHWPSDSLSPKRFMPEILEARALLEEISRATPNTKIRIFLEGNHEDWLRQAMVSKLPELFDGMDELGLVPDIKALLDLNRFGYDFFKMNDIVKLGKSHFTHGLYIGSNHAKKHLDALKANIYYGHAHDINTAHQPSIDGFIEAASLGCLCRLDAPFLKGKPNNWVHAFGIFEYRDEGKYSFYTPRIFNGEFSFGGRLFKS